MNLIILYVLFVILWWLNRKIGLLEVFFNLYKFLEYVSNIMYILDFFIMVV